jgi:integrase/recombinase XerC
MPAEILQQSIIDAFISYVDRGDKTTRTYRTNLRQFIKWTEAHRIQEPTRDDIIAYRDDLARLHKPNTVKQYLQSVRQFYAWAAAAGYYPNIAANVHAPKVRQDAHKKDALTAADVLNIEQSIAAHAEARATAAADNVKDTAGRINRATEQGKRLFAMYLLAVNAGLRTIEISRANVRDIGQRNGDAYIYIYGKGHTEADQKKPLALPVYEAIRDYLDSRTDSPTGSSPLFVATGNRSGGRRLATTTISTMLKRAMQEAGYDSDRITAHSLRHTAGTNAQEITGNLYLTQKYMRHASPATTEIYLHVDTERQEAEIARQLYNKYHSIG